MLSRLERTKKRAMHRKLGLSVKHISITIDLEIEEKENEVNKLYKYVHKLIHKNINEVNLISIIKLVDKKSIGFKRVMSLIDSISELSNMFKIDSFTLSQRIVDNKNNLISILESNLSRKEITKSVIKILES